MSSRVLCPQLYAKLKAVFKNVKIANEGTPIQWNPQVDANGKWELNIVDGGEYYRIDCPFCGDTRARLWINHNYGQYTVDRRMCLTHLAVCFNETSCMSDPDKRKRLANTLIGFQNVNARLPVFEVKLSDKPVSPRRFTSPGVLAPITSLPLVHPAVRYLLGDHSASRGYTPELCDHYEISVCLEPNPDYKFLRNQIIFPIKQYGELVGWQARTPGDPPPGLSKYFTMPGLKKTSVLYNLDNALKKPFLVLTEGVTDVHKVGDYSVATLGCSLHSLQRQIIEHYWAGKPVVFLWDPEAIEEHKDVINEFQQKHAGPVIVVRLPAGTDPGSLATEVTWGYIKHAAEAQHVQLY
jgi:hypothetical protein